MKLASTLSAIISFCLIGCKDANLSPPFWLLGKGDSKALYGSPLKNSYYFKKHRIYDLRKGQGRLTNGFWVDYGDTIVDDKYMVLIYLSVEREPLFTVFKRLDAKRVLCYDSSQRIQPVSIDTLFKVLEK